MNPLHLQAEFGLVYQAKTLASALRLYARTGMKANSAYTPTAMLATASRITGHVFKRGQHLVAADALDNWVHTQYQ